MGTAWEDTTYGGGGTVLLGKNVPRGNTGGAVVRCGDVVYVGANGAEAGRSLCGFTATGDKVEGEKSEGRFMVEGGGGQSTSGRGDTTAPGLLGQ